MRLSGVDPLTPEQRSKCMSRIRGRNTKPELVVRSLVHALGYRFRLHRRDLPGTPDLVLPRLRKIIFVHGCFWHQHAGCKLATLPKSRQEFWLPKLKANGNRDRRNERALRKLGWGVMTVWECQLRDAKRLTGRIRRFLGE